MKLCHPTKSPEEPTRRVLVKERRIVSINGQPITAIMHAEKRKHQKPDMKGLAVRQHDIGPSFNIGLVGADFGPVCSTLAFQLCRGANEHWISAAYCLRSSTGRMEPGPETPASVALFQAAIVSSCFPAHPSGRTCQATLPECLAAGQETFPDSSG